MTPTVDERLASVIRALTDVIAPSLPRDAGLAQEQIQMCIGHLAILKNQMDATDAFEREEQADAEALARALIDIPGYGPRGSAARQKLADLVAAESGDQRRALFDCNRDICELVAAVGEDRDAATWSKVNETILKFEGQRLQKDRIWFAPFGFDTVDVS